MTNTADTELALETESERVTAWRACEMMRVGYEPQVAVELAEQPGVDLHLALELVERGCPAELAAKILL